MIVNNDDKITDEAEEIQNEIDLLEGLEDPDAMDASSEEMQLIDDNDIQKQILNSLLDESILSKAVQFLRPKNFTERSSQKICMIIMNHYKQFGTAPSKTIIKNEISATAKDEQKIYLLGSVDAMEHFPVESTAYNVDKIKRFAMQTRLIESFKGAFDSLKKGKPVDMITSDMIEKMEQVQEFQSVNPTFLSVADIKKISDDNPIDWLMDEWLMFGGLHMLSGHSFSGKSLVIAENGKSDISRTSV